MSADVIVYFCAVVLSACVGFWSGIQAERDARRERDGKP